MQQPDERPDSIAKQLIDALADTPRSPQSVLDEYRRTCAWDPEQLDTLEGQTGAEKGVSTCSADRAACELWFSLGVDAIYVSSFSSDSRAIAEAIIAQAR